MLFPPRKTNERIHIGASIVVIVTGIGVDRMLLGFDTPRGRICDQQ